MAAMARDRKWKVEDTRYLLERPWLRLREDRVRTARGVLIPEFHVMEVADWSCIVCLSKSGELVLVRQYRHGVGRQTLELPAGASGPAESALAVAQRELSEETGFMSTKWRHLASVHPEPTRHNHRAHLFLATDAEQTQELQLDPTEDVEVVFRAWADREQLLSELDHGIHVAALLMSAAYVSDG